MHQATHAKSALLRRAYARIASDEARHAQLSWDIAEWAESRLDRRARERIADQRAQVVRELSVALGGGCESEPVREVLGLPDAEESRRLFDHLRAALWS